MNNGLQPIVPLHSVDFVWGWPRREQGAEATLFVWTYIMTLLFLLIYSLVFKKIILLEICCSG